MSLSAAVIRELIAAGLEGEALAAACDRIEIAAVPAPVEKTARQLRNARYYQRLDVGVDEWRHLRSKVFVRDGFRCVYCGEDVSAAPQCDHINPLVLGGRSDMSNLATACKSCNSAKSGLSFEEWRLRCR